MSRLLSLLMRRFQVHFLHRVTFLLRLALALLAQIVTAHALDHVKREVHEVLLNSLVVLLLCVVWIEKKTEVKCRRGLWKPWCGFTAKNALLNLKLIRNTYSCGRAPEY